MTVGMLLESLGGKIAALSGNDIDATPFSKPKGLGTLEWLSSEMRQYGFDPLGSETYYSGINGEAMEANVFVGLVYYQRLRHMIYDKY